MNAGMILVHRLSSIEDPRVSGRCDHGLVDILLIALCATMAGAEGWDGMEAWGEANEERLRLYVGLRNGVPGHDTIRRVFEAIDPKQLEMVLLEWVGQVCPTLGKVIAIDGKSMAGFGIVRPRSTRFACGQRLRQRAGARPWTAALRREIQRNRRHRGTAAESEAGRLHRDDRAMGCQTQIAAQVIERQGDYLLNAKDNQLKLAEAMEEYIEIGAQNAWKNLAPSQFESLDKGHGRVETRRCVALAVPDYLPEITRWPGIKSIARIEAIREAHGKRTSEVRYLIGSMAPDAREILTATRLHWGIENGLHRCLDVAFREDASTVHLRQAAANLGVLRKLAMNIFRLDTKNSKLSLPRKRKKAAWQPDYLFDLLDLQPLQQSSPANGREGSHPVCDD